MKYIADQTGLELGKDIQQLYLGKNYTDFNNVFLSNPGKTMIGLMFCTALEMPLNNPLPFPDSCKSVHDPTKGKEFQLTPYLIVYNHSLISTDYQTNPQLPFPTYPTALQVIDFSS